MWEVTEDERWSGGKCCASYTFHNRETLGFTEYWFSIDEKGQGKYDVSVRDPDHKYVFKANGVSRVEAESVRTFVRMVCERLNEGRAANYRGAVRIVRRELARIGIG